MRLRMTMASRKRLLRTSVGGGPSTVSDTTFSPRRITKPRARFSSLSGPPFFDLIYHSNKIRKYRKLNPKKEHNKSNATRRKQSPSFSRPKPIDISNMNKTSTRRWRTYSSELLALGEYEVHVLIVGKKCADKGPRIRQRDSHSVIEPLAHLWGLSSRLRIGK